MIAQPVLTHALDRVLYRVHVIESKAVTASTHLIRVAKPAEFVFQTSQIARVHLQTINGTEIHPLSIASSPARDYLEFAVRRSDSAWKQAFFALKPGDHVHIEGPIGHFFLNTERPAVLIAGGIGITPFRSMIEYAADAQLSTDITLLYSNRVTNEIAFYDELTDLATRNSHLTILHTITRSQDRHTWNRRIGRIDESLLRQVSQNKPDAIYYICGTPSLVNDTVQMLAKLNISPERIHLESFKGYAKYAVAPQV
jgi:ferredoxin-NADP reductase